MNNLRIIYLICLSFLASGILTLLRLPMGFVSLGPFWLVLILLYWVLTAPQYINVGAALVIGFVLDIVYNTAFGEHAMALVAAVFFITKLRVKIMGFGLVSWQMSLVIFCIIMCYQCLLFFIQIYLGEHFSFGMAVGGTILSALVWLPVSRLLFNYQRKLHILVAN